MNQLPTTPGIERLPVLAATILGLGGAFAVGMMVANAAVATAIVILAIFATFAWTIFARDRWWVLMPAAGALGGYFYFGHKIYTNEVALVACLTPLAMARAIRAPGLLQDKRRYLPTAMYVLTAYLVAHWAASVFSSHLNGTGGYGNISRAYVGAVGSLIFILLFKSYGSTRYMQAALLLTYLAALFRTFTGLIIYFTESFAYVPVINYVLPGSTHSGSDDLRASGSILLSLSLCYFLIKRSSPQRLLHGALAIVSCAAIAMGGGRIILILSAGMLFFAAAIYRKFVPFVLTLVFLAAGLATVNFNPRVLHNFSPRIERTLSVLLINKDEASYYGRTATSDLWHEDLRNLAYKKWTESWHTVLFGTGIEPIGEQFLAYIPGHTVEEDVLESASKVGAYESGWSTVLAVTGVVGFALYLSALLFLLKRLFPPLIRDRVEDHSHAFAFLAVFGIINWILFGLFSGSFPTTEIMFGFLAFFALNEQQQHESGHRLVQPLELTLSN